MFLRFMNSGPGRRRSAGLPRSARRRIGWCEKYVQRVDRRIRELLYAGATARAGDGPITPRERCRRLRQARDWEKVPYAIGENSSACLRRFRRGGSKVGLNLGPSIREMVRTSTARYFWPATSCSIFSASDISRRMDAGSSAKAPSPGNSSRCWLSL